MHADDRQHHYERTTTDASEQIASTVAALGICHQIQQLLTPSTEMKISCALTNNLTAYQFSTYRNPCLGQRLQCTHHTTACRKRGPHPSHWPHKISTLQSSTLKITVKDSGVLIGHILMREATKYPSSNVCCAVLNIAVHLKTLLLRICLINDYRMDLKERSVQVAARHSAFPTAVNFSHPSMITLNMEITHLSTTRFSVCKASRHATLPTLLVPQKSKSRRRRHS
jgi:hypothetical protein